jgi:hypothetical protein
MSGLWTDLPWLDRYQRLIASMLPSGFIDKHPTPHREIAEYVGRGRVSAMPEELTALNGLSIVRAAWRAVGDLERLSPVPEDIRRILASQFADGHFLKTTPDDHPESVWYFELQMAHAVATTALLLKNESCFAAAQRAGLYVLKEIQPDHATNRPWGLNAFLLSQETLPLVDWILHSTTVHLTTTTDELTLLLLADCLYCFGS